MLAPTKTADASEIPGLAPADAAHATAGPTNATSSAPEGAHGLALESTYLRDPERYQVIGEHGRGGIGRVFRAHDLELGRDIAIKELLSRGPVSELRFHREARITARLEHPGIVPVYEAGLWPDGTPFYAMKLVAGRSLRELITARTTVDERIGLLHHVIAVADAIAYAHSHNIVHRDLKPSNVIVGDFGETIVIDWGIAKDLTASEEITAGGSGPLHADPALTAAGDVLGTPAYMAPEQKRGEPVDQRADVYAIGAMLWELCALQKAVPAEPHLRPRLLRSAGIDGDLITIVDKALAPDPARRYPDAGALAADLKAFKSGARITARSYSLFAMLAHWTRRHRALAFTALACSIVVIASAIALGASYRTTLETQLAQQVAELSLTQAEVEGGRQALLHDDAAEALPHLAQGYRRGDHSTGVAFMLARALEPRLAELARYASASGRMWSATFSPDGRRIVTTDDTCAQVWDAATSRLLFTLPDGETVGNAVYSPNGTQLVTTSGGGTVKIWDATTGAALRTLTRVRSDGKPASYFDVTMSPDGALVAATTHDSHFVEVWDAATGAPLAELASDGLGWPSIAFSADGRWLATSGGDDVRVFDSRTWGRVLYLDGPGIQTLAFDPTGPRLVTGTGRGAATIWEIPSGRPVRRLRELGEPVSKVAFSPDGALVLTASDDGAEQIWDAVTGRLQS